MLIPFLVSRQIFTGAGKVLQTARGPLFSMAQRAEHIWEGVSSATTRSRPIINTRDEPHADAEKYRRLHVIVGDSNMSEYTTFVKVGSAACMLRMLEDPSVVLRDMTLESPIRAIRDISPHDMPPQGRLANETSQCARHPARVLDRFQRYLRPISARAAGVGNGSTASARSRTIAGLDRGVDWVIIPVARRCTRHHRPRSPVQLLDLQYHDIPGAQPVHKLQDRGLVRRMRRCRHRRRGRHPPQTTRARLRGGLKRAKGAVDYTSTGCTQTQRSSTTHVLCKDPFKSRDERVEKLIASL